MMNTIILHILEEGFKTCFRGVYLVVDMECLGRCTITRHMGQFEASFVGIVFLHTDKFMMSTNTVLLSDGFLML